MEDVNTPPFPKAPPHSPDAPTKPQPGRAGDPLLGTAGATDTRATEVCDDVTGSTKGLEGATAPSFGTLNAVGNEVAGSIAVAAGTDGTNVVAGMDNPNVAEGTGDTNDAAGMEDTIVAGADDTSVVAGTGDAHTGGTGFSTDDTNVTAETDNVGGPA